MATLKDIMNLAKADGGKFFVMDENGDVKLVIMDIEDYQGMLLGKLQKQVQDIETINKEIVKAQLQEEVVPPVTKNGKNNSNITIADAPKNNAPITQNQNHHQFTDMREEVIDPSFDFEGPKVNIDEL
jgi:hypothetical protein